MDKHKAVLGCGFILHHPVGICITPCRRCVRANVHQPRNYASGNTNLDVDAVLEAAVKNVQIPRICGRRQVLSAIVTLCRVDALMLRTNSHSKVDAVSKPQSRKLICQDIPRTLVAVSESRKLSQLSGDVADSGVSQIVLSAI